MYIKIVELKNTIHTNQTRRFGITSQSGMQYIIVMVKVDSNAILVEPFKNRTSNELKRAYLVLLNRVKVAGIVLKKHVLDNKCSNNMKNIVQETCRLELVQPYCLCCNVAEVAIKNFKAHFISILAGVDDDFPIRQWDKLLTQAELTLNLLRQANANPKLSAYSYLFGNFDYNRLPLAPLGCAVQVHVPPERRTSWGSAHAKVGTLVAHGIIIVSIHTSTTALHVPR